MHKVWSQLKERWKHHRLGFTLVEMLIVLLVVGLLMAIIIPNVAGQRDRIDEQARVNIAEIIETQYNTYELMYGGNDIVSLNDLYQEQFITENQLDKAVELLNLSPEEAITIPILTDEER